MLLNQTYLSFGEIADRWARENASHPAALKRDKILAQIVVGLLNNEFNYAELTIWRTVKRGFDGNGNYVSRYEGRRPVTRDMLNYLLFHDAPDPYNKQILEELKISKKGFRQWCKKRGYLLPIFWFDPTNSDAPPETDGRLSGSARYEDWAKRQTSLIKDGKADNYREAAGQIANSENVDIAFVERECRRVRNRKAGKKREQ